MVQQLPPEAYRTFGSLLYYNVTLLQLAQCVWYKQLFMVLL
jgi:hypothetical protein